MSAHSGGTATDPQASVPPPPPPVQVSGPLWRLEADPALIDDAAQAWRYVGTRVREISDDVKIPADRLIGSGWTGATADTFDQHRRTLLRDVYAEGDLADFAVPRMEGAANALRSAQHLLDDSWHRLVARVPAGSDPSGNVVFYPSDEAQVEFVYRSIREAESIRAELDDILLGGVGTLERIRREWQVIGDSLEAAASGTTEPFTLPPEATGPLVIQDGNNVVVNTGPGNDRVEVVVDPVTGQQTVVVNGVATTTCPPGTNITIRAGQGNDEVVVPPGTPVRVTLLGGTGDDELRGGGGADTILGGRGQDKIFAGGGDDHVSGGADRDYIDGSGGNDTLDGGLGDDTLYGLSGQDQIAGGEGYDYLEGGTGDDTLDGGAGNDMISGGRGDDRMRGGSGEDSMYAGHGRDTMDGGAGRDVAYSQSGDATTGTEREVTVELTDAGSNIRIEGSPEFVERVQADIDMMRSSPRGQQMLEALEEGQVGPDGQTVPHTVTIREGGEHHAAPDTRPDIPGAQSDIYYNPSRDYNHDYSPPIVSLYHEMAHVYDEQRGTADQKEYIDPETGEPIKNFERVATGLPVDHDGDPSTTAQLSPDHPYDLTENAFREELGYDRREEY